MSENDSRSASDREASMHDMSGPCPLCGLGVEGDTVTDPYGFVWHRSCYDDEASIGTFNDQGGKEPSG
jgi:hypothetical protein